MNKVRIRGMLTKTDIRHGQGLLCWLEVGRRSAAVDRLMVMSPMDGIPEGPVEVTGRLGSGYIPGMGTPAYIVPYTVAAIGKDGMDGTSEAVVTGKLKKAPVLRETHSRRTPDGKVMPGKPITTLLLKTRDGCIPAILWGPHAQKAVGQFRAGSRVQVVGRMQSRQYPDGEGGWRTTYELSARSAEEVKEGT